MEYLLSLLILTNSDTALFLAKQAVHANDHETASAMLLLCRTRPVDFYYLQAIIEYNLNHRDKANAAIDRVLDEFEVPLRYERLARLMREDMKTWKDDQLDDIARKMRAVESRLQNAKGGPETQRQQKEIIDRLDKMIADAQKDKDKASQQAQGKGDGKEPGDSQDGQSKPADDSDIKTDSGKGEVLNKRLKGAAETWGKLPEKDRAKAIAELTREFPPRYRELIEQYFKNVAKNDVKR